MAGLAKTQQKKRTWAGSHCGRRIQWEVRLGCNTGFVLCARQAKAPQVKHEMEYPYDRTPLRCDAFAWLGSEDIAQRLKLRSPNPQTSGRPLMDSSRRQVHNNASRPKARASMGLFCNEIPSPRKQDKGMIYFWSKSNTAQRDDNEDRSTNSQCCAAMLIHLEPSWAASAMWTEGGGTPAQHVVLATSSKALGFRVSAWPRPKMILAS